MAVLPLDFGSVTAAPPESAFLERVTALGPEIAAAVDEIDRERRLPQKLLAQLIEAGLFRMLLPRPLNGAELDPPTFVRVIEEIAKIDASTAWCVCQNAVCATVAASLPMEAAWEIFGRDPRAILAWGPGPNARAVAVEGGYRISGTWSFASGCRNANWFGAFCPIFEVDGAPRRTADGKPVGRTMLFPSARATVADTWDVVGLRGTASDAYSVAELFVPEAHSLARDDPAERRYRAPLYCFPVNSLYGPGFAAVALGLARSLLDAFVALAQEKTPRGDKHALRHSAVVQAEVAEAEARLRAARRYVAGTLSEIWHGVERSNALSLEQRMAIRLAASHAIQEAVRVADTAYHAAGATAIFASNPFERRFRDIHTMAQQLQGRRSHYETVGKFLLGVETEAVFL